MQRIVGAIALCIASACATTAPAQPADAYPQKPVRMVVGYAAGGGADALARIVAGKLTQIPQ